MRNLPEIFLISFENVALVFLVCIHVGIVFCEYTCILLVGCQILGDQQAALVGQGCLKRGQVKNTYVM